MEGVGMSVEGFARHGKMRHPFSESRPLAASWKMEWKPSDELRQAAWNEVTRGRDYAHAPYVELSHDT